MSKIVVVAGNYRQFHHWVDYNIIPVVSNNNLEKLLGMRIERINFEGSYKEWISPRTLDFLRALLVTRKTR
jgi:hypothetical protein